MALLNKETPNIIVNTGMNPKMAWEIAWELRKRRYKVIALSSMLRGYGTYYDYMMNEIELQEPLMISCSDNAKQKHLNHFYNTLASMVGHCEVNIGFTSEENKRFNSFKDTKLIHYSFPLRKLTREECMKICLQHNLRPEKSGCVLCPKSPSRRSVRTA